MLLTRHNISLQVRSMITYFQCLRWIGFYDLHLHNWPRNTTESVRRYVPQYGTVSTPPTVDWRSCDDSILSVGDPVFSHNSAWACVLTCLLVDMVMPSAPLASTQPLCPDLCTRTTIFCYLWSRRFKISNPLVCGLSRTHTQLYDVGIDGFLCTVGGAFILVAKK